MLSNLDKISKYIMVTIDDIIKIELEITSDCNAACPGCARTRHIDKLLVTQFSFNDLKRIFPDVRHIKGKEFKLCGVLGDPMIHPEVVDITEYLLGNGGSVTISTNAGVGKKEDYYRLGMLSSKFTNKFIMQACIDGHRETNHIYRVNTKFDVIERNLKEFAKNSYKEQDKNRWVFIVFDHNEYEIEAAKKHATELGMVFYTRTGMRNDLHNWIAELGKKNNKAQKVISTSKEHKGKQQVLELDKLIATNKVDTETLKTIKCKYVHEGELFINSQQQLWPCCFLWDTMFRDKENIREKYSEFGPNWNNLKKMTIDNILASPYYDKVLQDSWNPNHNKHLSRCIRTCGYNAAYQNKVEKVV
tara:strand:+ start:243 stop:1322 length:1080 start_codon:yes stop_codon:yes gene_type:complete